MKYFAILAIFALIASVSAFTEEQLAKGKALATQCAQEQGVDAATIEKIKSGDFSNDDKKIQCFANCFLEKVGFMKDGQLQESVVLEKLSTTHSKEHVQKVIDTCKGIKGADNCETSFKTFKCYHDNKA